jgi:hypothetical protein
MILHMNIHQSGQWFACATLIVVAVGCGSSADAGASGVGGAASTNVGGGASTGGSAVTAGGNASGGTGAGTTSGAGNSNIGGATATGGTTSVAGATAAGGITSIAGATAAGGTMSIAGATAVGGTTAAGGNAGNGGTSVAAATGTLGQQCSTPGTLACNGLNQKLTLVCGGSNTWQVNQTCNSATQVCDPRPGSTQGICQEQDALCATAPPGQQICNNSAEWICDAWAMKATKVRNCPYGACSNGKCIEATGCLTEWNFLSCSSDCASVLDPSTRCRSAYVDVSAPPTDGVSGSAIIYQSYANAPPVRSNASCSTRHYFTILPMGDPNAYWRVQVTSPWLISLTGTQTNCTESYPSASCIVLPPNPFTGSSTAELSVYTDNANAQPVNVYIEASATEPAACP